MNLKNTGAIPPEAAEPGASIPVAGSAKGGEGGEPGAPSAPEMVTNEEFLKAIFAGVPEGASAVVCSKGGDPTTGGWPPMPASVVASKCAPTQNNYFNCSSFYMESDGSAKARTENFAACHVLMLDDLDKQKLHEVSEKFAFSWVIETSEGNHQAGIILATPLADRDEAKRLLDGIIKAGMCDPGSTGPSSRWARLPVAINGKPKHRDKDGKPRTCRLRVWNPEQRYTGAEIVAGLNLQLESGVATVRAPQTGAIKTGEKPSRYSEVYTSKAAENPVITALKAQGLYKKALSSGKHDVTCPWVHEHTDALDNGAAYFEPNAEYPVGGFCCQHSHREEYRIGKLLQRLDITRAAAKHKPLIRIVAGEMEEIVDAAEKVLAEQGRHYYSGGLLVSISHDPLSGDSAIVPTSISTLTKELAGAVEWEKLDGKSGKWIRCDPPPRHIAMLSDAQACRHLPVLSGLTRQPYFREVDRELVTQSGYDAVSHRYGVFKDADFVFPAPTPEAARSAMDMLERLISGFHFAAPADRAAALAAIFTAVVRPSLALAPGFHVRAPVYASGKTYLCEVIGAFAGPGHNLKVSYPKTSEEATKSLLSLLLTGPAVIEFDDMDSDWKPHGVVKRVFTSEKISDRILGVSKTATVSTRTLFLGSGNNVGPERDLLRRVLTINIDPRCAIPAMLGYKSKPLDELRRNRGKYVVAVLTVIQAWRLAGSPRTDVPDIASYGDDWSDLCRHPLIWMGQPDPVAGLVEQVQQDPDSEALGALMKEWHAEFGSSPVTVRKALFTTATNEDLDDALRAFPVLESGRINASKMGWMMRRNANRIVDGFEIRPGTSDGRKAWAVVPVNIANPPTPASPPSPSFPTTGAKKLTEESVEF